MARKETTKGGDSEYHKSTESAKDTENKPRTKTFHAMPAMPRTGHYSAVFLPSFRGGEGEGRGVVGRKPCFMFQFFLTSFR